MQTFDMSLIGKTINVRTLAPGILPSLLKGVQIVAILDPATAKSFSDVISQHMAVRPHLTGWQPATWKEYNYAKIIDSKGETHYYGLPWLDLDSIEEIDSGTWSVVVGSLSTEDINRLRRVLIAAGFDDIRSISPTPGSVPAPM